MNDQDEHMQKEATRQILIIGGSYFLGRVFVMTAASQGYAFTLINRGRYSLKGLGNVTEFRCDRHDAEGLSKLPLKQYYDAVVDFCAYEPGDIEKVLRVFPCRIGKYIYISTADVSKPARGIRNEESPLRQTAEAGAVEQYLYKKMLLESEIKAASSRAGCQYTILRPVFIYGPYNYAPRESWYIQKILRKEEIPHPVDADGAFRMVYVKDVARAILLCIEKDPAKQKVYILSAPETMTYDRFLNLLRDVSDQEIRTESVSVAEVIRRRIPLPFPLTEEENGLFDGSRITEELGFQYSDLKKSMTLTWNAFRAAFIDNV